MPRQQKEINWVLFEKLITKWPRAVLHDVHIADYLGCPLVTLQRAVRRKYKVRIDAIREQKEKGLRRTLFMRLWEQSGKGNLGATIWLTKHLMHWTEVVKQDVDLKAKTKSVKNLVFNVEFGDGTPAN